MKTRSITFPGAHGDRLSARVGMPPDGHVQACALFAHCFTCSKDLKAAVNITRALTQAGIAVLRFDFTGLGESEGDFTDTTFTSNVDDLVAAAGRHVGARPERDRTEMELREGQTVAARAPAGGFRTEILARGHALLVDEPRAVGGDDLGPTARQAGTSTLSLIHPGG